MLQSVFLEPNGGEDAWERNGWKGVFSGKRCIVFTLFVSTAPMVKASKAREQIDSNEDAVSEDRLQKRCPKPILLGKRMHQFDVAPFGVMSSRVEV
jgi:hypothetical protein